MAFLFALEAALAGMITGLTMFFTLVFVRVWFGLLSPGLQPASMAAMTDATTPTTRAAGLGMLGAAMSIGSIIGPAGASRSGAVRSAHAALGIDHLQCITCGILDRASLCRKAAATRQSCCKRPSPLAMRDATGVSSPALPIHLFCRCRHDPANPRLVSWKTATIWAQRTRPSCPLCRDRFCLPWL